MLSYIASAPSPYKEPVHTLKDKEPSHCKYLPSWATVSPSLNTEFFCKYIPKSDSGCPSGLKLHFGQLSFLHLSNDSLRAKDGLVFCFFICVTMYLSLLSSGDILDQQASIRLSLYQKHPWSGGWRYRAVRDGVRGSANLQLLVETERGISICQKSQSTNASSGIQTLIQLWIFSFDYNKNRS